MPKPVDRVQLLKQETAEGGGDPNDVHPLFAESKLNPNQDGLEAQGLYLQIPSESETEVVDEECYVTRNDSGDMLLKDENANGGAEVTLTQLLDVEAAHETLDTLVHAVNETSWAEVTRTSGRITNITVWDSDTKTTKVRETQLTRTSGRVTQMVSIQYDGAGAEVHRLTRDIVRVGGVVTEIDNTKA